MIAKEFEYWDGCCRGGDVREKWNVVKLGVDGNSGTIIPRRGTDERAANASLHSTDLVPSRGNRCHLQPQSGFHVAFELLNLQLL